MKTCDTCTHYNTSEWKVCTCPKIKYGYSGSVWKFLEKNLDGLCVEDDEGWGMVPGPKFGCIHHVPKEQ